MLDTYYYSSAGKVVKKVPSELSDEYKEWLDEVRKKYKKPVDMISIDSAEGAMRNQLYKDHGIRLHPIAKGKKLDMIDYVYDL